MFEVIAQAKTIDAIDQAEIDCISQHNSSDKKYGYNIALGGNGKRIVSEETKKKISKLMMGRKPSEETLRKRSLSMLGKNKGDENGMFGTPSENTTCAKLTLLQALEIKREYSTGDISSIKLARKYGVSKKTIWNILHDKIYKG